MNEKCFQVTIKHVLALVLIMFGIGKAYSFGNATEIVVTGQVTDRAKQPLPGVSVSVKGTKIFASTNVQGKYSIRVADASAVLVFNFMGFAIEERTVGSNKIINVTLSEKANNLDEVVVVGYGTQKKSDLTGSVASIKGDELNKTKTVSFQEAMQGKIAGVQITSSSGEPGAGVNINIRGANSINAGTTPLYVIDGVQIDANNGELASFSTVSNPLTSINPSDIESIEVLKDASATAIFGSRGANGVIIVTTKSGKGASKLELDTYWGVSRANKKLSLLNGQDYAAYRYILNPASTEWGQDTNGDDTPDQVRDFSGEKWYDWQEEVLKPALSQNYNISYSAGGAKTNFLTSLGYFKQDGIVRKNKYERFSANLKIDHNATSKFRIGTTINGSYVLNTGVASSGGQTLVFNGIVQSLAMYKPVNVADEGMSTLDPDNLGLSNPLDFVNFSQKQTPLTRLVTNVYGEYKILPGLSLRLSGGGVLTDSENGEFYPSSTSWGYSRNGMAILNTSNTLNWFQTHTLTYTKRLKDHYINALAGFEANSYRISTFGMRAEGFDIQSTNAVDNIHQAKVLTQVPTTNRTLSTRISQFGRINYNYKNKYFFTSTLRRDGSSKFGADNKYALFPSAALAWTISRESFLKNSQLISNLKIRTSFGVTGNDRIPAYQSLATANTLYYSGTDQAELGMAFTTIANPALKWETTYQYDAGLDLDLLKGRFGVVVDVYKKETKDMLLLADVPGQTGFNKQWQNIGRVDNKGIEFGLNSINVRNKNFSWNTNLNITFNRNKVVSLGDASFLAIRVSDQIADVGRVVVGEPIGTAYGLVFDGIYQTEDFTDPVAGTLKEGVVKRTGVVVKPGDFKFKDLNGDNAADNTNDRTVISDSNPKHFGGLTNSFNFKGIDLSILFMWSYGNDILNVGRYRTEGYQSSNLTNAYWQNRWTETNPSNEYPRLNATGRFDNSTYYVEDGSFLRLKNVTLGYNLPAQFSKKLRVNGLRVYLTGENLLTWTDYSGYDPEVASNNNLLPGFETISYPRSRTFTMGLNVKF